MIANSRKLRIKSVNKSPLVEKIRAKQGNLSSKYAKRQKSFVSNSISLKTA